MHPGERVPYDLYVAIGSARALGCSVILLTAAVAHGAPRKQRGTNTNANTAPATAKSGANANGNFLPDPAAAPPPGSVHAEGDYGGVAPDHPSPTAQKPKHPVPGTLSWIGFEAKDGGAQIFLQSMAAFEVAQHVEGGALVVEIALPRLGQNTWRDVDTRYFDTPVAHLVARRVGAARATKTAPAHSAGIEVRIAFKSAKDAREAAVRTATEADGMYYAYLSIGGAAAAQADAPVTTPDDPEK